MKNINLIDSKHNRRNALTIFGAAILATKVGATTIRDIKKIEERLLGDLTLFQKKSIKGIGWNHNNDLINHPDLRSRKDEMKEIIIIGCVQDKYGRKAENVVVDLSQYSPEYFGNNNYIKLNSFSEIYTRHGFCTTNSDGMFYFRTYLPVKDSSKKRNIELTTYKARFKPIQKIVRIDSDILSKRIFHVAITLESIF